MPEKKSKKTGQPSQGTTKPRRDFSRMDDHSLVSFALGFANPTALTQENRTLYMELKRRNLYDSVVKPAFERMNRAVERPYEEVPDEALIDKAHRFLGRMELSEQDPELKEELTRRDLWATALPKRRKRWDEAEVRAVAAEYETRHELARNHPAAYYWAIQLQIVDDIFDGEGNPIPGRDTRRLWTPERIVAKAQLCKTRSEFHKRFPGAYAAARSMDILDEVCAHMGPNRRKESPSAMSNTELWQEAALYDSPNDFLRGNRSAYNQIVRRGLFSRIAKELGWTRH